MQILRAAEDYLEAMLMMQQKHGYIRSIDIAEQLGVTKPSVTYTTKRLRENGYITMDRDGLITLTPSGMDIAARMLDRHGGTAMLKIGEFSKLSRVSVRMLRHYDEVGLLAPSEVDSMTGYRYYSERQLITAGRIAALRALGFGLSETRELLRLYDDRAALDARLAAQRTRLEALAADTAQKLRLLDTARERLRKEADMNYNVTIRTLPERYAACVRMTIPCYDAEGTVWDVLCRETDHMHLVPDDPCYCSVTFLDEEYKERDVLIEASKTVRGRYPDTEHVRFRTLPPVTYAGCVYRGSYAQISDVIAAVAAWVAANGYESAGPMFNIYHVSPHETQNPDEFVTEVCFPVREA